MSNGYKSGAFALGLVVGLGITLNLFLWLDYSARDEVKAQPEPGQDIQYSEIGKYWDGFVGAFVSPSDTLAQWIMAFFTIAATGVLILTLRSANKTNIAAVQAAEAALDANKIMREAQRPWVSINPKAVSSITYQSGSNTLMLAVNIAPINQSVVPAQNLAIGGKIKIISRQGETGLRSEDWIDLRKEVAAEVVKDSIERRMTQTIFPNRALEFPSVRYIHAHLNGLSIPEKADVALVACVSVSYKTPTGQGGAIWHGVIVRADVRSMFTDFIASAKSGSVAIEVIGEPVTYY